MIYISGSTTGVKDYEYHFMWIQEKLERKGRCTINPVAVAKVMPPLDCDEYMTVCMALLSLCDSIYMLKGYEQSKGAMQELEYAKEHGYKVVYEE